MGANDAATFEFSTNLGAVADEIDQYLTQIEQRLSSSGGLSGGAGNVDIVRGITSQFGEIASRYTQLADQLGTETREAIAAGLSPAAYGSQIAALGARMRTELTEATRSAAEGLGVGNAGINFRALISQLNEVATAAVRTQASFQTGEIRSSAAAANPELSASQISAQFIGRGSPSDFTKALALSTSSIDGLTAGADEVHQRLISFAESLADRAPGRLTNDQFAQLQGGANGENELSGNVTKTSSGSFVFDNPVSGSRQVISGSNYLQGEGSAKYQAALAELTEATEQQASSAEQAAVASQSANEATRAAFERYVAAKVASAEAAESQLVADRRSAELSASGAGRGGGTGGGGANAGASGLGDSFLGGLFGHGFQAGQAFDPSQGLSNLVGTFGVLARYGGVGRALFAGMEVPKQALTDLTSYEDAIVNLDNALAGTTAKQVNVNAAISAGAQSGIAAADSINLGAVALESYSKYVTDSASATQILTESVQAAGEAAVLTGQQAEEAQKQLISATFGFNSGPSGQQGILDAAVSASRNTGASRADILQGLSTGGIDAQQAGLSPDQYANIVGLVSRDTGSDGSSAASLIQKLIVRGQNQTFIQALQALGVQNSGDFSTELPALSKAFNSRSGSQQDALISQLGGARAIGALLPLLRDGTELTNDFNKSQKDGGSASKEYIAQISTLGGVLRQLSTGFKDLITEIGRSGVFLPLGIAVEAVLPALRLLNSVLTSLENAGHGVGDAFKIAVASLEVFGAVRLAQSPTVRTLFGRGAAAASTDENTASTEGNTESTGENSEETAGNTAAVEQNTAAVEENAAANQGAIDSIGALTAARGRDLTALEEANAAAELQRDAIAGELGVVDRLTIAMSGEGTAQERLTALRGRDLTAIEAQNAELLIQEEILSGLAADSLAGGAVGAGRIAPPVGALPSAARTEEVLPAAEEEGAGFGARAGSFLTGSGILAPALTAIIGAGIIKSVYGTQSGILNSADAAQSAQINATSAQSLQQSAQDLEELAQKARASSGGFTGSILNFLEGNPTGAASKAATSSANLANADATALGNAENADAASGTKGLANQVDLNGSAQNLTDTLQGLAAQGYDADQVVAALTDRLTQFIGAARTGVNTLLPDQVNTASTKVGVAVGAKLKNLYDTYDTGGNTPEANFKGVNFGDITTATTAAAKTYLTNNGFQQGGTLSAGDVEALAKQEKAAIIAELERQGKTAKEIAALGSDIDLATIAATRNAINEFTNKGTPLTDQQVGAAEQFFIQQASAQGSAASTKASLSGGVGGVAGAQKQLDELQKKYNLLLQNPGTTPAKLSQLSDAIDTAQLGVQQATVTHLQAVAAFATAGVSPFDADGQIASQIAGLQSELKITTDHDARLQLKAQIEQLNAQAEQQALNNIESAALLAGDVTVGGAPVNDIVAQAQAKLSSAQQGYDYLSSHGATGSALTDAQQNLYQAQLAYAQAQVQDANDARDGAVAVGDAVGAAAAQYQDLLNTATTETGGAKAKTLQQAAAELLTEAQAQTARSSAARGARIGPQATVGTARNQLETDRSTLQDYLKYAPDDLTDIDTTLKAIAADKLALKQAIDQRLDDKAVARVNPEQSVKLADDAVKAAARSLAADQQGTDQYYKDLATLTQARLAYAQSIAQKEGDQALAAADPASELSGAKANVAAASDTLGADKKGTDQYAKDRAALKQALFQERKAQVDTANALIDADTSPADDIQQAKAQIEKSENDLTLYKAGTEEYYEALAQLKQAQYQLGQALAANQAAEYQLGTDVTDPVAQAKAQLEQDILTLQAQEAAGDTDTAAQQVQILKDQYAVQKAAFDQQNSIEEQLYNLHQISGAQYLQYLENEKQTLQAQLAGMQAGSQGYQQTLQELLEVESDILNANQQLTGQFNVGNINTNGLVYQERALAGRAGIDISADTTGSQGFGVSNNPAQAALQPLTDAITAITDPAANAATYLTSVAAALNLLTGSSSAQAAGSSSSTVNNAITLQGVPINQVMDYLSSILGAGAIQSRSSSLRKVG